LAKGILHTFEELIGQCIWCMVSWRENETRYTRLCGPCRIPKTLARRLKERKSGNKSGKNWQLESVSVIQPSANRKFVWSVSG
jgi:hypothetical protein